MELIENTAEKLILRMEANESLANAIRRSVSEIPVLAIQEVEIFKNDSALYDEVISHRLGLVPLKTEKGMSEKTNIELKISKVGPCMVYSEDLTGNAEIVHGRIPIVLLSEGKKLELIATAVLGKGIEHSKHVPGLCFYRHLLKVKSNPKIDKIISESKLGLVKPEKKGSLWICDLLDIEVDEINKIEKDAISDSDEILFVIESYGNMSAKDILIKSTESLKDNLADFEKALK